MENEEVDEYDRTKYFMNSNREKIYARRGGGHKGIAYRIIGDTGLDGIYYFYEARIPAPVFLTYCGYVMVDEGEERTIIPKDIFDDFKTVKYTSVGYCSISIDKEFQEELKGTYCGEDVILSDVFEEAESPEEKKKIEEIVERIREFQVGIKRQKENQLDEEER